MVQVYTMNEVTITRATLNDVDTLWQWGEENWELWGDDKYKWFSKKSLVKWISDPKDDVLLVARKNDTAIGMCMVFTLRNWAFCVGLFVEKEFRGVGLGKKLLDKAIRILKRKGVESILLLVDTKNEAGIRFYEREKFYKGFQFFMMTKDIKEDHD